MTTWNRYVNTEIKVVFPDICSTHDKPLAGGLYLVVVLFDDSELSTCLFYHSKCIVYIDIVYKL